MALFPPLESIKEKRRNLGWTQKELAERSGVSQSAITKIEKGLMIPSYSVAVKIFEALERGEREKHRGKTAKDIMNENVISLYRGDRVKNARELMEKHAISQIPVIDERKQVVGMITENDILKGLEKHGPIVSEFLVEEIMSEKPLYVRKSTPLTTIIEILKQEQAVVVVEKGKLEGIITKADIVYKGLK